MIPISVDRDTLNDFYLTTGLNVRHLINDEAGEKTLRFDRLGAFPVWDIGAGAYLFASGEYFKKEGDIELETLIIIEQTEQLIVQTEYGKNYIVVLMGVNMFESCYENDDDYDEKEIISSRRMNQISNQDFTLRSFIFQLQLIRKYDYANYDYF